MTHFTGGITFKFLSECGIAIAFGPFYGTNTCLIFQVTGETIYAVFPVIVTQNRLFTNTGFKNWFWRMTGKTFLLGPVLTLCDKLFGSPCLCMPRGFPFLVYLGMTLFAGCMIIPVYRCEYTERTTEKQYNCRYDSMAFQDTPMTIQKEKR